MTSYDEILREQLKATLPKPGGNWSAGEIGDLERTFKSSCIPSIANAMAGSRDPEFLVWSFCNNFGGGEQCAHEITSLAPGSLEPALILLGNYLYDEDTTSLRRFTPILQRSTTKELLASPRGREIIEWASTTAWDHDVSTGELCDEIFPALAELNPEAIDSGLGLADHQLNNYEIPELGRFIKLLAGLGKADAQYITGFFEESDDQDHVERNLERLRQVYSIEELRETVLPDQVYGSNTDYVEQLVSDDVRSLVQEKGINQRRVDKLLPKVFEVTSSYPELIIPSYARAIAAYRDRSDSLQTAFTIISWPNSRNHIPDTAVPEIADALVGAQDLIGSGGYRGMARKELLETVEAVFKSYAGSTPDMLDNLRGIVAVHKGKNLKLALETYRSAIDYRDGSIQGKSRADYHDLIEVVGEICASSAYGRRDVVPVLMKLRNSLKWGDLCIYNAAKGTRDRMCAETPHPVVDTVTFLDRSIPFNPITEEPA